MPAAGVDVGNEDTVLKDRVSGGSGLAPSTLRAVGTRHSGLAAANRRSHVKGLASAHRRPTLTRGEPSDLMWQNGS